MKKKMFFGYAATLLVVLLMVSSATAVYIGKNEKLINNYDEKSSIESDESPDEEKPKTLLFAWLVIEATRYEPVGPIPGSFLNVNVKNLDTGITRTKLTGLFGYTIFFGLPAGCDYEVRIPKWGKTKIVENLILGDWINFYYDYD